MFRGLGLKGSTRAFIDILRPAMSESSAKAAPSMWSLWGLMWSLWGLVLSYVLQPGETLHYTGIERPLAALTLIP